MKAVNKKAQSSHPAHGPVSLDRLHQISEILSKASAQSDGGNLGYAMADAVKVINGAIAAFGAEPVPFDALRDAVAEVSGGPVMEWSDIYKGHQAVPFINFNSLARIVEKFRTAPPAPVVPESLPCPVLLEPGLKFGKGVRTQCMLDALNRRAEYHAELDAMTPDQRAEHDAGIAEFKAMLGNDSRGAMLQGKAEPEVQRHVLNGLMPDFDGVAMSQRECFQAGLEVGKSRAIPDGWVMVPIIPTEDMIINGFESVPDPHFSDEKEWEEYEALSGCRQAARRAELCWEAMISAAPKQENI